MPCFYTEELCTEEFYTEDLLHREVCAQGGRTLYTESFTHRAFFYTENFLHRKGFTHRNFYTGKSLYRVVLTQRSLHTLTQRNLLHRAVFTQSSFYTEKIVHAEALTQRSLFTEEFLMIFAQRSF